MVLTTVYKIGFIGVYYSKSPTNVIMYYEYVLVEIAWHILLKTTKVINNQITADQFLIIILDLEIINVL